MAGNRTKSKNGRSSHDDESFNRIPFTTLDQSFYERVEKEIGVELDEQSRRELREAFLTALFGVFKHRATASAAADALEEVSNKGYDFLEAIADAHVQFPGLLQDVAAFAADADGSLLNSEEIRKISPMVMNKKWRLLDDDQWEQLVGWVDLFGLGTRRKAQNIRSLIPPAKPGRRPQIYADRLIKTAIKILIAKGFMPKIGGSYSGPFARFLADLYNMFPISIRSEIAISEEAFLGRGKKLLNNVVTPKGE